MIIESPSFAQGGFIPLRHTCDGANTSPPLVWRDMPAGTKSLALIVDDPDAPDPAAPKMTWVHWLIYNIPADAGGLTEDCVPPGALLGVNDSHRAKYAGPCPVVGRHRYFFRLYALDLSLPDLGSCSKAVLLKAMQGHVLGCVQLVGLYQRKG